MKVMGIDIGTTTISMSRCAGLPERKLFIWQVPGMESGEIR